jgi:TonB family protein
VLISLTLGKGGDVKEFQILNSDSEILSGGAKSMVERASPFPNIPDEMAADWITLKLPIRFNLY